MPLDIAQLRASVATRQGVRSVNKHRLRQKTLSPWERVRVRAMCFGSLGCLELKNNELTLTRPFGSTSPKGEVVSYSAGIWSERFSSVSRMPMVLGLGVRPTPNLRKLPFVSVHRCVLI